MNDVHTHLLQDSLTGLPTRIHMNMRLADEWNRHIRPGLPLSVLMIEVDRFDRYAARFGIRQANKALRLIGLRMRQALFRETDLIAHTYKQNFAAVLPDTDIGAARLVADRLRKAVEGLSVLNQDGTEDTLTVSIGSASCIPRAGYSPDDLLSQAEEALLDAKTQGRRLATTL